MNWMEFIIAILVIIVVGLWGLLYLSYKYGNTNADDTNKTKKSK